MPKPQSPINKATTYSNHVSLQSHSLQLSDSCDTNIGQASIPPSINQYKLPFYQALINLKHKPYFLTYSSIHMLLVCFMLKLLSHLKIDRVDLSRSCLIGVIKSRNFTSAAAKEPKIKVGGSGNYAFLLYIATAKAKTLDKVETELFNLVTATEKSPTFSQFMKDLETLADTRVQDLTKIYDQAKHVDTIAKRFSDLTMAHEGEVKAVVTTVIPFPAEEEKQLKDTIHEILGQRKKVKFEQKVYVFLLEDLSHVVKIKSLLVILHHFIDRGGLYDVDWSGLCHKDGLKLMYAMTLLDVCLEFLVDAYTDWVLLATYRMC
nr:ATP synthase subunit O, mitochondrial-like [Tanacetum cinerariifolium]